MSTEAVAPAMRFTAAGPEHCIAQRADGVFADPAVLGTTLVAAIDAIFRTGSFLAGLDYPVFIKALYGHGPALPRGPDGETQVRIADAVVPFDPARQALYRSVKIGKGYAEYYFEPVWLDDPLHPDGPPVATRLDVDEFVADAWNKGVRFGIDLPAVRAAIAATKADRITVARRLDPVPGEDARIVEVSDDIHRSDAPRQLANGRLDLHSFQNRFPQIQPGVRLLRKAPASAGADGFELSGARLVPTAGRDTDLASYAGPGTVVERQRDGDFLLSSQAGFLCVDAKTSQISIGAKVVSHDGVSAKTTGNLSLSGDYEEFGEVQEKRIIEADSITVHGDVFGSVVSRGGSIVMDANLVGGSARNAKGDIHVRGVASGALLQAADGAVVLERAENCVIAATRVTVRHAINCDIIGDDVTVVQAEACAVAGRRVTVECATPRKQGEMLVAVLQPEGRKIEEVIGLVGQRVAQFGTLVAYHKAAMEALTTQPEVRRYLLLASKVRKHEVTLSPEQARQFQKMGQDVAPALKAIGAASGKVKEAETERQAGLRMLATLEEQRHDAASIATVAVRQVQGDTQVRILGYSPAEGAPWRLAPRDIKLRLRGTQTGTILFTGAAGAFDWTSEPDDDSD